jgi:hypothetical protein
MPLLQQRAEQPACRAGDHSNSNADRCSSRLGVQFLRCASPRRRTGAQDCRECLSGCVSTSTKAVFGWKPSKTLQSSSPLWPTCGFGNAKNCRSRCGRVKGETACNLMAPAVLDGNGRSTHATDIRGYHHLCSGSGLGLSERTIGDPNRGQPWGITAGNFRSCDGGGCTRDPHCTDRQPEWRPRAGRQS